MHADIVPKYLHMLLINNDFFIKKIGFPGRTLKKRKKKS